MLPKATLPAIRRVVPRSISPGHSPRTVSSGLEERANGKAKPAAKPANIHFDEDEPQALIQWPSEQQICEVCDRLLQIKKIGVHNERHGDYFNSGDLAYQVQEIIKATDELFRKSQRVKHRAE